MNLAARRSPFLTVCHRYCVMAVILAIAAPAGTAFAQQKKVDSLLGLLNAHSSADSVRLSLLNKLSASYAPVDTKNGIAYADKAIQLAKQLKDVHGLAGAYINKGVNFEYQSEPGKAVPQHLLALGEYNQLNNKYDLINCYIRLSSSYYSIANYATELEYASKATALAQAQQTGDPPTLMKCYTSMGISYNSIADYPKAINYFFKVLRIAEAVHDKSFIAKMTGNLGVIYYFLKKYPESLKYHDQCLKTLEELDDKVWIAAALNNIGAVYLDTKDYPKAIFYNKRALAINRLVKSKKGEGNDLMDMGVAFAHLNNYAAAFTCIDGAIRLYGEIGAKNNSSIAFGHLAEMYTNAPPAQLRSRKINPAKRYDKALEMQQKAVNLALETKNLSNEADQWKALSMIYRKRGSYREALKSYLNFSRVNDSIFNDAKKNELTRLSIQYDYDRKEAALKAENTRKQAIVSAELGRQRVIKNASIIVALVLIFSGITTFGFYKRRKDAREKLKEAEYKARVAETEMKALRSQLNPHFIFNSLNSIGDYIARHDKETADLYLLKFAKLMRMILENSEQKMISLADDLKTLELYMQLEALRLGHGLLYEILIDDEVDAEIAMVPPMMLQPFVENSIWHGLSAKNSRGKIIIRVKKDSDMIEYVVEDNGIGREQAAKLKLARSGAKRKSFGIKVTQSRINMINEGRRPDSKVELTDLDEGTRVSIWLPYELKF